MSKNDYYLPSTVLAAWGRWCRKRPKALHGPAGEVTVGEGLTLAGHLIICEDGAVTPSHNPLSGFLPSIGWPRDDEGNSLACQDFENSDRLQAQVTSLANDYTAQLLQEQTAVVTYEGVVIRGHTEVMAGMLAARINSDEAYCEAVRAIARQWGKDEDEILRFRHPRLVFMLRRYEEIDYSPRCMKRIQ